MLRPTSMSGPVSAFNNFLYAAVGDDRNGLVLTVLSVFARQNLDPWEEAAELSRLPRESARTKLLAMLEALPAHSSLADRTAITARLMPLLPQGAEPSLDSDDAPQVRELSLVLIYVVSMIVGLWMFTSLSTIPGRSAVADPAPPHAAQPSSTARREQP